MDQTKTGVGADDGAQADPEQLKQDIDGIRRNLGGLVAELDRRRHEMFDVRLQIRRHPVRFGLAAFAIVALAGTAIGLGIYRRRQRRRLPARVHRLVGRLHQLRMALARALDAPEHLAPRNSSGRRVLKAGGKATATLIGRQLARRLVGGGANRARR